MWEFAFPASCFVLTLKCYLKHILCWIFIYIDRMRVGYSARFHQKAIVKVRRRIQVSQVEATVGRSFGRSVVRSDQGVGGDVAVRHLRTYHRGCIFLAAERDNKKRVEKQ